MSGRQLDVMGTIEILYDELAAVILLRLGQEQGYREVGPDPQAAPRLEMAYILCQQIEMVLLVFSLAGLLTGAIVEANRDYPTDPFPLLVAIWLLALLGLLAGAVMGFAHWAQLFRRRSPPQTLDDPPPPPPAPDRAVRFGSDRF